MEIPEATLSMNNDRPTIPSTDNTSGGNTEGQNRATTNSTETISEGVNSSEEVNSSEGVNSSSSRRGDSVNTSTAAGDNVSPSDTLRDEGEPIIQQTDNTNGERENLVSTGQTLVNAEGGMVNESNSSGNEGEGGPEGGS